MSLVVVLAISAGDIPRRDPDPLSLDRKLESHQGKQQWDWREWPQLEAHAVKGGNGFVAGGFNICQTGSAQRLRIHSIDSSIPPPKPEREPRIVPLLLVTTRVGKPFMAGSLSKSSCAGDWASPPLGKSYF